MSGPPVEVLTFEGCPHAEPALELVKRVLAESGVGATVAAWTLPTPRRRRRSAFLGRQRFV